MKKMQMMAMMNNLNWVTTLITRLPSTDVIRNMDSMEPRKSLPLLSLYHIESSLNNAPNVIGQRSILYEFPPWLEAVD